MNRTASDNNNERNKNYATQNCIQFTFAAPIRALRSWCCPLATLNFADSFRHRYAKNLLPGHIKALEAMAGCRHEHGPHLLAQCANHQCDKQAYIPHSCGHRNCPHCQNHESQQWIEQQLGKRLPCKYYLITFTLPEQLRDLAWKNQSTVYTLMFATVQDLLKSFTKNDKKLGGNPGFTAILHTQARSLDYHPHIHVVMPGASINLQTNLWKKKSGEYLSSHKALARVFRAKLLQAMVDNKLSVPHDCPRQWVVDCKDAGNGDQALIYLGRYLYRGVIREKDILCYQNGMVTFRYRHAKSGTDRTRTVTGEYFLYLLMLHVLPRGFRRARSQETHPLSPGAAADRALAQPCQQHETTTIHHLPGLRGRHGDHRDNADAAMGLSCHSVPARKTGGPARVNRSSHHGCQTPACAATG